jgi:hypothetical protein
MFEGVGHLRDQETGRRTVSGRQFVNHLGRHRFRLAKSLHGKASIVASPIAGCYARLAAGASHIAERRVLGATTLV